MPRPDTDHPTGPTAAAGSSDGATTELDRRLGSTLSDLLDRRAPTGSVCPSEVARVVGDENWRSLMEPVRVIARRLVARGEAEITQRGVVVDPATVTGPIRIRRPDPEGLAIRPEG